MNIRTWKGRELRAAVALGAITALVAACAGTASSSPAPTPAPSDTAAPAASAETPSAAAEPVSLDFWLAGEVGTVNAYTKLAERYHELNPNVTINTSFMGNELEKPALLPALNAGTGPDVWQGGVGPGQPGAIIKAGHTLDLTKYFYDLGWDKKIPKDVVTRTSSDGKFWGIGQSVQTTMMFYSKKIFEELGLSIPKTWSEFIALEDKLHEKYDTVVGLPAGDGWPISHNQTWFWGESAGPDGINDILFGDGTWDSPTLVKATQALVDQNKAGYFGKEPLAVGYRDSLDALFRGDIPMVFTGTFFFPDYLPKLGDTIKDFGAFAVPNPVEGQPIYPTESIAGAWYVNSKTESPDEAAKFLDWLNFDPEARAAQLAEGIIPVGDVSGDDLSTLPEIHQEILKINDANRPNGSVEAFFDTILPANVATVTYDGLQSMLVGKTSAEQFNKDIQAAWQEAKDNGEILEKGGVSQP